MFSKKLSRAPSRASSTHSENGDEAASVARSSKSDDEDFDFTKSSQYRKTQRHPIGGILLKLVQDTTRLAQRTNAAHMDSNMED